VKPKVVVVEKIHPIGHELLAREAEVVFATDVDPKKLAKEVVDADGILVRSSYITREVFEAAAKLKVLGRHGVGLDYIDMQAATEMGIPVVNAPGSNTIAVAEHAIMFMLALAKNIFISDRVVRDLDYDARYKIPLTELAGKTLGLIGFGRIGQAIAKRCFAFDMDVIAYDPYLPETVAQAQGVKLVPEIDEILTKADVVSLHAPATEENYHLIDADALAKMKPNAYLINTARGTLIDQIALYEALKEGKIAGAALDVFEPEIPQPDNPLFSLDNVILSPHNAALTEESTIRMSTISSEGVLAVLRGERPQFLANPEVWEKRRK
jgi:D-3-phosphoglycerate dehydrogenase